MAPERWRALFLGWQSADRSSREPARGRIRGGCSHATVRTSTARERGRLVRRIGRRPTLPGQHARGRIDADHASHQLAGTAEQARVRYAMRVTGMFLLSAGFAAGICATSASAFWVQRSPAPAPVPDAPVADSSHYKVEFENEFVRVIRVVF